MVIKLLTFLLLSVNIGCSFSQEKAEQKSDFLIPAYTRVDYKATIDTIERKVVDLTATSDLFGVKEFLNIYMHAEIYTKEALAYIVDSSNTKQKRMIATYSMQNLSDSLYIDFCMSAAALLGDDITSMEILVNILFDSINDKYQIVRNYKNSNVFSGKTWRGVKHFLEENK
jgi:hypothetical protein